MGEEVSVQDQWLFPDREKQQAEIKEKGLVFAQKFLVFRGQTSDPRARELLETWLRMVRRKSIPATASIQELAAHNAVREFVEAIESQLEFANQGVNAPQPRAR